jgi:hemin uptake protein HemP
MEAPGGAAAPATAAPATAVIRNPTHVTPAIRELDANQLFAGANTLQIRHGGERYTLRRTGKGKLILTKSLLSGDLRQVVV